MFIINREAGAVAVCIVRVCNRALQQKDLPLQHLLKHREFLAGPRAGYLHCKKTLGAQEPSRGSISPHFFHMEDTGEDSMMKGLPSSLPISFFPGTLLGCSESPEMETGERK